MVLEDADRLTPIKDDNLKYAEITLFWAGSDLSVYPKGSIYSKFCVLGQVGFPKAVPHCCQRGSSLLNGFICSYLSYYLITT